MAINTQKKGALWVNNYHGKPALTNSGLCAEGFFFTLLPQNSAAGVHSNRFIYGDNPGSQRALDIHIQALKLESDSTGTDAANATFPGEDMNYAETVDILYFCGHGDPSNLYFDENARPTIQNSDDIAAYDDIILGDQHVIKWLVFDACETLKSDGIFNRWTKIFSAKGSLRFIFGFDSSCKNDNFRGKIFAEKLNPASGSTEGELFRFAWMDACEETDNAAWAILRVGDSTSEIGQDKWASADPLANIPTVSAGDTQQFTYQKRIGTTFNFQELVI